MSGARQGILHQYTSKLSAFEHTPHSGITPPQNLIIFIGGLFDGLLTVPYTIPLAESLPPTWTLANVLLSSSYTQWGTSSLQIDVHELSKCVSYFRTLKSGLIILMGHSTGCQDIMEYLTGPNHQNRSPIDGGILQASVSDREAVMAGIDPSTYTSSCGFAQKMVDEGNGDEVLPSKISKSIFTSTAPVTAKRFLSLTSPNHDGEDDYFSSDLSDEQVNTSFGALPERSPLCILFSGSDQYVPQSVDKEALVKRWIEATKKGRGRVDEVHSGIVVGGSHNLVGNEGAVGDVIRRVLGFIHGLTGQANL